jgi:hypothetical protein
MAKWKTFDKTQYALQEVGDKVKEAREANPSLMFRVLRKEEEIGFPGCREWEAFYVIQSAAKPQKVKANG